MHRSVFLRLVPLALTATLVTLSAASVHAIPPRGPDPFSHDKGFFMRLSGGGGYGHAGSRAGSSDVTLSGFAAQLDLAFGGIITPNLALTGELFGMSAFEPTMKLASGAGSVSARLEDTRFRVGALGVGLTYYFMPANIYASAAVGIGSAQVRGVGSDFVVEANTDPGLAINVMAGKEWWVARRWGLGVAVQFMFASLPDDSASENWKVFQIGVSLTATMN